MLFLQGKAETLHGRIESKMLAAADQLDFERAALYRDQLIAIEASLRTQDVDRSNISEADVLGLYREGPLVSIQVHQMRSGALVASPALPSMRSRPSAMPWRAALWGTKAMQWPVAA